MGRKRKCRAATFIEQLLNYSYRKGNYHSVTMSSKLKRPKGFSESSSSPPRAEATHLASQKKHGESLSLCMPCIAVGVGAEAICTIWTGSVIGWQSRGGE